MNSAAMSICVQRSESLFSFLLDICLGVGLLSYMVFTCGYGVRRTNTGSKGLLKQGPIAASQRAMARVIAKCKEKKGLEETDPVVLL